MEWVETTGKTIDEAKEAALDELGVDAEDAEFEVVTEPKLGLFGLLRHEGRVRARVRPSVPRDKDDRRDRKRRPKTAGAATGATGGAAAEAAPEAGASAPAAAAGEERAPRRRAAPKAERPDPGTQADIPTDDGSVGRRNPRRSGRVESSSSGSGAVDTDSTATDTAAATAAVTEAEPVGSGPVGPQPGGDDRGRPGGRGRRGRGPAGPGRRTADSEDAPERETGMDVALEEQGQVAEEFLQGLVERFGLTADVAVSIPDESTIQVDVDGDDLGLLIGPKGATLLSVQDLTRTVVQRRTGAGNGRLNVDVSHYRERRSAALADFARKVATTVVSSGQRTALEPMSSADRKVVHDTLTEVEGVETLSEGEDPSRRVVIIPAAS